jgi:hypothetical protein
MLFKESLFYNNAQLVAIHTGDHLTNKSLTWLWDGCYWISKAIVELHIHLDENHRSAASTPAVEEVSQLLAMHDDCSLVTQ